MSKNYITKRPNRNTFYYRRRVPLDLIEAFGKKFVSLSLKTPELAVAIPRAKKVDRLFDRNVALARAGKPIEVIDVDTPQASSVMTRKEMAEELLHKLVGITEDHSDLPDRAHWDVLTKLDDYGREVNGEVIPERRSPVLDAVKLLNGEVIDEDLTMTQVVERYIELKHKQDDKRFCQTIRAALNDWIQSCGDKKLSKYRRMNAHQWIDTFEARGLTKSTGKRRMVALSSAINHVALMLEIDLNNPFKGISVEIKKKEKEELTQEDVNKVLSFEKHTETTLLSQLLLNTGMRVAEGAGLLKEDIKLTDKTDPDFIPHVIVREHPHRTLKTKSSTRKIPLVGISLEAAKIAYRKTGNKFLFPSWNKTETTKNNSASAAVGKRCGFGSHSFRHHLTTRLRDSECPYEISQLILGHALPGETSGYGKRDALSPKQNRLLEVAY